MKHFILLLISFALFTTHLSAQSDSASLKKPAPRVYTHYDSIAVTKLNSSGNLMIAGGVGLCVAGGFLIYEGIKIYNSPALTANTAADDISRNHRQGTIYLAAAGVGIAGGIILTAFGARNKVEFKMRKKMMELQSGILNNGKLGVALNF